MEDSCTCKKMYSYYGKRVRSINCKYIITVVYISVYKSKRVDRIFVGNIYKKRGHVLGQSLVHKMNVQRIEIRENCLFTTGRKKEKIFFRKYYNCKKFPRFGQKNYWMSNLNGVTKDF